FSECDLTEAREFNLMFETHVGPVKDTGSITYLRPETAQGIFVNFKNVLQFARKKPPFGIAQIGKSFRNEITTGNFVFRTREFEQMEMEYFVPPDEAPKWHEYWMDERMRWYTELGIRPDKVTLRAHVPAEYDAGGSIGKRYRRQDEIGTPWGITVDGKTMEDGTVTLRDRDSLEQERVPAEGLGERLAAKLAKPWRTPKLG